VSMGLNEMGCEPGGAKFTESGIVQCNTGAGQ
jgi:hypothetical protein